MTPEGHRPMPTKPKKACGKPHGKGFLTVAERSALMSRIRGKGTKCEKAKAPEMLRPHDAPTRSRTALRREGQGFSAANSAVATILSA